MALSVEIPEVNMQVLSSVPRSLRVVGHTLGQEYSPKARARVVLHEGTLFRRNPNGDTVVRVDLVKKDSGEKVVVDLRNEEINRANLSFKSLRFVTSPDQPPVLRYYRR